MQCITTIQDVTSYIKNNSSWSEATIQNVFISLGYSPKDQRRESFRELSGNLADCSKHGADGGFSGFCYHSETIAFFMHNRRDILKNLELLAGDLGEDIIKMVQGFGVFRSAMPPSAGEVGKALWDTGKVQENLTELYNVFSWFCLEEISHVWYRYLEDNPAYYAKLTA
ncbi:hypothetical protein AGMMS50268_37070 [Spirochaetia bacterium]|nr:hypothetical protein AGMMS49546_08520 [Spirochaetia bacterium]GHV93204.1 hypothetical protein AGMMS50268_37070 [Spirochaetia bacterium]